MVIRFAGMEESGHGNRGRYRLAASCLGLVLCSFAMGCFAAPLFRRHDVKSETLERSTEALVHLSQNAEEDCGVMVAHMTNIVRKMRPGIEALQRVANSEHPSNEDAKRMLDSLRRAIEEK